MMLEDTIPMEKWGRDHWSTFAYVETVCVEDQSFSVVTNPRMRTKRRHFRILAQETRADPRSIPMDRVNGTVLNGGTVVENHDDWDCIMDMIHAGLLTTTRDCHGNLGPHSKLTLSKRGHTMAAALRKHKASGGQFANFTPTGKKK